MADRYFYSNCHWRGRPEPLEACAHRLESFLRQLKALEPVWDTWTTSVGTDEEGDKVVHTDASSLAKLLGRRSNPSGTISGYWLRSGAAPEGTGVYGRFGGSSAITSTCSVATSALGRVAERVMNASVLTSVMRAMALAWEPEFGVVTSPAYRDRIVADGSPDEPGRHIGWITYIAHSRGPVPLLPAPVRVERMMDRGTLILLTPENFTLSNPDHVALAAEVQSRLQAVGLLGPLRPWVTKSGYSC
ncbi:immunity 52 family protein [Corallococcus llansteffanensis]|uniref:Immunity protein 52 domain-containing protein n=1 Tax=Corallococcus llansteffanensis TaxID=2316731 RepID=A0A3A8PZG4_9BACT|nr:immunity 52 family protein [Corallococcus llansteffanensis]RKH61896.1 hypothetical protein D7V93_10980 [Corallococcus llansteffanensis]